MSIPADLDEAAELGRTEGFPVLPAMAESWEVSTDGTMYRFALRQGVLSHFGNEFTSADAAWTIRKSMDTGNVGTFLYALAGLSTPDNIREIDTYTLELQLDAASPFLLQFLSLQWLGMHDSVAIAEQASDEDPWALGWLADNVASYGPYELSSLDSDGNATLTAFADYWGPAPAISTVVESNIEDANARLQLLISGEVDYAEELSPLQDQSAAENEGTSATKFTSAVGQYLVMNTSAPPFDSREARQAVARSIPYDDIVETIYGNRADRWKTLITPWFFGATDEFWVYETDPDAARSVLTEIGQGVRLTYRGGRGAGEQLAIVLQTALEDAGLDVELEQLTSAVYDERKLSGELDFFIAEEIPAIPSSLYNFFLFWTENAFLNMAKYANPELDAVVAELTPITAAGTDEERQLELIREGQRIVVEDLPFIPIAFTASTAAHGDGLVFDQVRLPGGSLTFQDMRFEA